MICKYCNEAELVLISGDFPWNEDHYQCPNCDSTYNQWEIDGIEIR